MTVFVLNGPNLGRLGLRQPELYGSRTYAELVAVVEGEAASLGFAVDVRQTDSEATLAQWLHEAADSASGVVLNAGALSHYSYVVRDAAAMVGAPLVEVHLTNIAAREEFRHHSVVSAVADGVITGLGFDSYLLALRALKTLMEG